MTGTRMALLLIDGGWHHIAVTEDDTLLGTRWLRWKCEKMLDNVVASNQDMGMSTNTTTPITKDMLTERKRGKGGSIVVVSQAFLDGFNRTSDMPPVANPLVVKDLMQRVGCDKPDRIGVGPADRGIAFGVFLEDVEAVVG